jgi:hypothetical protein
MLAKRQIGLSVQLFTGEVEERSGKQQEHKRGEKIVVCKRAKQFGAEGKEVRSPRQPQGGG